MILNRIKVLFLIIAIATLSACGTVGRDFVEEYSLAKKTRSLGSSPKITGILAIEVDFNDPYTLTDISLAKINEKNGSQEKAIKVSPANTPKPKRSMSSILQSKDFPPDITVFEGLEPGKYTIKTIRLSGARGYGW